MPQIQNCFLCIFLSEYCCEILKFCYNVFNDYISLKRKKAFVKNDFTVISKYRKLSVNISIFKACGFGAFPFTLLPHGF